MEFQKVVNHRKMIRSFKDKDIPTKSLERIISNIFKGPSAGYSQGTEILVLRSKKDRELFYNQWGNKDDRESYRSTWPNIENANKIIIICTDKNRYLERYSEQDKDEKYRKEDNWEIPWWLVDSGMAILLGLLTVVDEELAASLTRVKADYIREHFYIPDSVIPMAAILIGYKKDVHRPSKSVLRGKRKLNDIVHYDKW